MLVGHTIEMTTHMENMHAALNMDEMLFIKNNKHTEGTGHQIRFGSDADIDSLSTFDLTLRSSLPLQSHLGNVLIYTWSIHDCLYIVTQTQTQLPIQILHISQMTCSGF